MNNKNCEIEIKQFYHNTNVFITGATGFLGKALLEKLLFSCDVGNVYILIRPKKGKSASERLEILLQNQVSTPKLSFVNIIKPIIGFRQDTTKG